MSIGRWSILLSALTLIAASPAKGQVPTPALSVTTPPPSSIEVGQSFTIQIRLQVQNAAVDHAGISVSFPSLNASASAGSSYDTSQGSVVTNYISAGTSAQYFPAGSNFTCSSGPNCTAAHLLAEADWANVSAGSYRYLYLTVTPKQVTSSFKVRVRSFVTTNGYANVWRNPTSGTIDQQGWPTREYTVAVTAPTYSLKVTVNNISGTSVPATNQGRVTLYTSSGSQVGSSQLTNSSRQVTFSGLSAGNYSYKVEHLAGALGQIEYWGQKSVSLSGTNYSPTDTFNRNQPYIGPMTYYDQASGASINENSTIPIGTVVRSVISIGNASPLVTATLYWDQDRSTPYDSTSDCSGTSSVTCTSQALTKAGAFYRGYILRVGSVVVDSGNWYSPFSVTGYNLTITVNNVTGTALPAANQGRVTLFNASTNVQVGSPLLTNASRQVTFSSLPAGSYYYRVEHLGGALGQTEYWGQKSVSLSGANFSLTDSFRRDQPYIGPFAYYNNATNTQIANNSTVAAGTIVRSEITIGNPSGTVTATLYWDSNRSTPYDSTTTCQGTPSLSCISQALSTPGAFYHAYILRAGTQVVDSGDWYTPITVAAYSLQITVSNVAGTDLPALNQGRVTLFNTSTNAQVGSPQLTNANRQVTFTGLAAGSYYYKVEHLAGALSQIEYWGQKSVSLSGATYSVTDSFTRNQPYIGPITHYNNATNAQILPGTAVPSGTVIRSEITVMNSPGSVTAILNWDSDRTSPFDSTAICTGTSPITCLSQPLSTNGPAYLAYVLKSASVVVDSGDWASPLAIGAYSLKVTVNNVTGTALPAAGQGRVTLFNSSNNTQVGTPQLTDAARQVTFSGLAAGNYYYKVEHLAGALGQTEYWGQKSVALSGVSSTVPDSFNRNQPYVGPITYFNNATGAALPTTSPLPAGVAVRSEIQIGNPAGTVSVTFYWDQNRAAPYDSTSTCSATPATASCISQALTGPGPYHHAYILRSGTTVIDSGDWYSPFASAGQPDLVPNISSLSPVNYSKGSTLTIGCGVRNESDASVGTAFLVAFYLSSNGSFDASDTLLKSVSVGSVAARSTAACSTSLQLPGTSAPGAYWVIAKADSGNIISESAENNNTHASPITVYDQSAIVKGTTIITHGFAPSGSANFGEWMQPMAQAICRRTPGGARYFEYDLASATFVRKTIAGCDSPDPNSEAVLVYDWAAESNDFTAGMSEAAGESLFALLVRGSHATGLDKLNLSNLHLIGHSRGTIVNSEAVERLLGFASSMGLTIDDLHVTTLDPHDSGDTLFLPFLSICNDWDVNDLTTSAHTRGMRVWQGEHYHDNYYQFDKELAGQPLAAGGARDFTRGNYPEMDPFLEGCTMSLGSDNSCHGQIVQFYLETVKNPSYRLGYALSRIGSNKAARQDPAFSSTPHETVVPLPFDPWSSRSGIVNGDFARSDQGSRKPAGWWYKGGSGGASVAVGALQLEELYPQQTRNWFYIPQSSDKVFFSYYAGNTSYVSMIGKGTLTASLIGESSNVVPITAISCDGQAATSSISVSGTTATEHVCSYSIPSALKNAAAKLSFRFTPSTTGSYVRISDVHMSRSGDSVLPQIYFSTPTTGLTYTANSSPLTVTGYATDASGIAGVTWKNNRGYSGTATLVSGNWTASGIDLQPGSNTVMFAVRDGAGNTAFKAMTITYNAPDTIAPDTVVLSVPAANAEVSGSVHLSATARDGGNVIKSIAFHLDGNSVPVCIATGPLPSGSTFTCPWDSRSASNGAHFMIAKASDPSDNIGSSPQVGFTVNNSQPPPAPPSSPDPSDQQTDVPIMTALSWLPSQNASSYRVHFGTKCDALQAKAVITQTTYPIALDYNGLIPDDSYCWKVEAIGSQTVSSPLWTFRTLPRPGLPTSPSPLSGTTINTLTTTLTWTPGAKTTSQIIRFGTTDPPTATFPVSANSYTPASLSDGQTYYWQVVESNSSGSTSGPVWSFTAQTAPPPSPTIVGASPAGRSFTVDGTTFSAQQSFNWAPGSPHTICTTSPQPGATGTQYVFTAWSDNLPICHSITASASGGQYIANFTTQYYLTTAASPSNGGSVTPVSSWQNAGASVQLKAAPATGYTFQSWTGASGSATTTITIDAPKSVTANFAPAPAAHIVTTNPAGRSFTVDGTTFTSQQSFNWTPGSPHTICTASPQPGSAGTQYVFANWSDNLPLCHSITASASGGQFTANFNTQFYLTTAANPTQGGAVAPLSGWQNSGATVQLVAAPTSGFTFQSWTGASGSASTALTMDAPKSVTANFTILPSQHIVATNPAGRSFSVDGTTFTSQQSFVWTPGTPHTICATSPQAGAAGTQYLFSNWSDSGPICHSVTAQASGAQFTANFTTQFYLTTSANPANGGSVSPSSGWHNSGATVNLQATAAPTFSFQSWSGDATGLSPATSVTMSAPRSATATFSAGSSYPYLVFLKSGNVWAIKPDGTGLTQLTTTGDVVNQPRLAADTLVYQRGTQLYRQPFAGGAATAIPNTTGVYEFDLNPAATKLVLTYSGNSGSTYNNQVLYTLNIDGSAKTAINTLASQHNATFSFGLDDYIYLDQVPVTTPLSQKVYRIPQAGVNNSTNLVSFFSQFAIQGFNNRVIFYGNPAGVNTQMPLYVMSANGSAQSQVPNATMDSTTAWPAFDPTADVAYWAQAGNLYRINLDGSAKQTLTTGIQSGVDFGVTTSTPSALAISGAVTLAGQPLAGVSLSLSGSSSQSTTTSANGAYSFSNLPSGGTFTVAPSSPSYSFTPPSLQFNSLTASITTANFTAVAPVVSSPIPNPGFESGTLGPWLTYGAASSTVTNAAAYSGAFGLSSSAGAGGVYVDFEGLTPQRFYHLTARVKASGSARDGMLWAHDGLGSDGVYSGWRTLSTSQWEQLQINFRATQSGMARLHLETRGSSGALLWDDVQITEGWSSDIENGTVSPWIPFGTVTAAMASSPAYGLYSLALTGSGGAFYDAVGLVPGRWYHVKARVRSSASTSVRLWLHDTQGANSLTDGWYPLAPGVWKELNLNYQANAMSAMRIHIQANTAGAVTYWDAIQVLDGWRSDFESPAGATGWTAYGSVLPGACSNPIGSACLAQAGSAGGHSRNITGLRPGRLYRIRAKARAEAGATASASLSVDDTTGAYFASSASLVPPSNAWREFQLAYVAPITGSLRIRLATSGGGGTICWDDIELLDGWTSDFEDGLVSAWSVYGAALYNATASPALDTYSLAMTGGAGGVYRDLSGLTPNQRYHVSARVRSSAGATATATLKVHDTAGANPAASVTIQPSSSQWQLLDLNFTATSLAGLRIHLDHTAGSGTLYWDDVEVQEGWVQDFESARLAPFTAYGATTSAPASSPAYGAYSLAQSGGTGGAYLDVTGLQAGRRYQVSARARSSAGATGSATLWVHDTAGANTTFSLSRIPSPYAWEKFTLNFTATSSAKLRIHLAYSGGSGSLYWDEVRVNEGWTSDLENGSIVGWNPYGAVTQSIVSSPALGAYALAQTGGTGGSWRDVNGLIPGKVYLIVARSRSTVGASAQSILWVHDTANNNQVWTVGSTPSPYGWDERRLFYQANPTGAVRIHLASTGGTGSLYWDEIEIVPAK